MAEDFFQYYNKKVKIVCKDGDILIGLIVDYIPTGDSDDFQVHLGIRTREMDFDLDIPESNIESIQLIEK